MKTHLMVDHMAAMRTLSLKVALCPAGTVFLEPWPIEVALIGTTRALELQMLLASRRHWRIIRSPRNPLEGVTGGFWWVHLE